MEKSGMKMEYKNIEQKLSQIGAKIANATDLLCQVKELVNSSESTLIDAQKAIDALYVALEDDDSAAVSVDCRRL